MDTRAEYVITDMAVMPSEFSVLPNSLNHSDYGTVLAWCAQHGVPGRLIRYESKDGKLMYWAVVKNDEDND